LNSPENKYRIILADDHPILREGLKKLIAENDTMLVVGEAGDGTTLIDRALNTKCDLAIVDLSMPGMDGLKAIEKLKMEQPDLRVLILTMHDNREYFKQAVSLGVEGYMLKEDVYESLISAIDKIRNGERAFSPKMSNHLLTDFVKEIEDQTPPIEILTRREKEILAQVSKGLTSKQIADSLKISSRTVESHRARIMEKLSIHNVAGLVKYAMQKNLL
jgi:DNA-binding NarL/FixJ family response regulator